MEYISKLKGLVLVFLIISSCSKDGSVNDNEESNQIAKGKTSLFKNVVISANDEDKEVSEEAFSDISVTSSVPGSVDSRGRDSNTNFEPGILTAGQWNDLENWDFWKTLLNSEVYLEGIEKWNLKSIKRYSFQIVDANESFVANAEISLLVNQVVVWKTKTDNKGKATLWTDVAFDEVTASVAIEDAKKNITDVKEYEAGINIISLDKEIVNNKIIDIYFAIDATGSMGDEIDYLKAEVSNVIERVKQRNSSLQMRFGSVFYRDEGDQYVTRDLSFTSNEADLVSFIKDQSANGGGNYPEAVHSALDVAIAQNTWNDKASTKLLFLLLDAPPHYTQEVMSSLEENLILAAENGIKIIPISASGIDKATEYLMRYFAIFTNGTYVFITDDSGVGNPHITPTVGKYEVQKLNELLIDLVDQYIP
ncbi:vWA domain-containing protein [Aquimarina agarivorans]|uniref:vWA domain-containing protein n=1 Tax=Aquimarina agarivorans TaxID=980584 RepID=UPI000248E68A|nr:vWA domain-containing protein [Aquimarina agarivorans]